MYHIFWIHYSLEGQLGSFQLLAILNKATMNIVEHVSVFLVSLWKIMCQFISRSVNQFQWSICLFLCQYSMLYTFFCCSSVVYLEIRDSNILGSCLIVIACFCYPGFSFFQIKLSIVLASSLANCSGILMVISLNL